MAKIWEKILVAIILALLVNSTTVHIICGMITMMD